MLNLNNFKKIERITKLIPDISQKKSEKGKWIKQLCQEIFRKSDRGGPHGPPLGQSRVERKYTWNKYQSKTTIRTQNPCLNFLIYTKFQGNEQTFLFYRLKMIKTEKIHRKCFPPKVKKKITLL